MTRRAAALLLAPALLCAAGCQTSINPVTGRRQVVLMSEADERQIDAAIVPQIENSDGLVRDPRLTDYVEELGRAQRSVASRVATTSLAPWHCGKRVSSAPRRPSSLTRMAM